MSSKPLLFEPIMLRDTRLANRIVVSPLCQYCAIDGMAQPWHMAHLSSFARGKAGLVFTEASAVEARGRITPQCLGIWNDAQADALQPIVAFIEAMGCVPGIQLAHAGRKGSARAPFVERGGAPLTPQDAEQSMPPWQCVAASALALAPGWPLPSELDQAGIEQIRDAFLQATRRALRVGFRAIELHFAHGYLLHSFLSPLSNLRSDAYGGDLEGRMRLPLEIVEIVRAEMPVELPLFVRISAIDSLDYGWSMDDSVILCQRMAALGVDVVDCSSGGISGAPRFRSDDEGKPLDQSSARAPGFQVPFSRRARSEAPIKSMAVGVIVDAHQAEEILQSGGADLVALGRELMYDPFWPLHAAEKLGVDPDYKMWPQQYAWAVDRRAQIRKFNR